MPPLHPISNVTSSAEAEDKRVVRRRLSGEEEAEGEHKEKATLLRGVESLAEAPLNIPSVFATLTSKVPEP